ncbi:Eif4g [Bugula neritina]|uniref:Eif4g n=1 Tax=Bugula neritina TaxID=10212 RepID=A0A7J7J690_BUGNE|nr:Eif4g [Bugula neritina]
MLAELIKHEILPLDLHLKGVAAALEFAEDLAIDIPSVWNLFRTVDSTHVHSRFHPSVQTRASLYSSVRYRKVSYTGS